MKPLDVLQSGKVVRTLQTRRALLMELGRWSWELDPMAEPEIMPDDRTPWTATSASATDTGAAQLETGSEAAATGTGDAMDIEAAPVRSTTEQQPGTLPPCRKQSELSGRSASARNELPLGAPATVRVCVEFIGDAQRYCATAFRSGVFSQIFFL